MGLIYSGKLNARLDVNNNKIMPSCVIPTCKNRSGQSNDNREISFHRFPKDEEIRKHWISVVRKCRLQENWTPNDQTVICSAHFDTSDIHETPFLKIIVKGAIPKKNIATGIIDLTEHETKPSLTKTVTEEPADDSNLSDVDISDLEYLFDSPLESQMRRRIHRKIESIYRIRRKLIMLRKTNMDLIKNKKELRESIVQYVENYLLEKLQMENGSNETEVKPS